MSKYKYDPDYGDDPEILHGVIKDLLESTGNLQAELETQIKSHEAIQVGLNKQVADLQTELDKNKYLMEHGTAAYVDKLQKELAPLKEFARHTIMETCWGLETDGWELQDLAEKLGLVVSHIATEADVDDESDYGVGDKIFVFSELLKGQGNEK